MARANPLILLAPLVMLAAGCPVTQPQDTPADALRLTTQADKAAYWLYVPSYYDPQRTWPLVVTLHGTNPWDSSVLQIMEWKALAEEKGFLVVAPDLRSTQGILPVIHSLWEKDLAADDRAILAVLAELRSKYNIDPQAVLLTGFSAGGYPLYYTGLRHPERFGMLIARACNSSMDIFEGAPILDAAKDMPIIIYWGRDDAKPIRDQSWQAYRWLRQHSYLRTERHIIRGGHIRHPELAWRYWQAVLPAKYKN